MRRRWTLPWRPRSKARASASVVLVDMRFVDEIMIVTTLTNRLDLKFVDLNQIQIPEVALKEVASAVIREHNVLPLPMSLIR